MLMMYCSKTGLWETEKVRCLRTLIWCRLKYSVPLNGILHWLAAVGNSLDANYVVSCDFLVAAMIILSVVLDLFLVSSNFSRERSQHAQDL